MVRIWDKWLADREAERPKALPAIVPVVLAHAEGGWTAPVSMQEIYALPPDVLSAVQQHLPHFELVLDDLSRRSDQELRARALEGLGLLALLLMRWSRNAPELMARLGQWGDAWRAVWEAPDGHQALGMVVRYLALATEPVALQDLTRQLEPMLGEGVREVIMTEGQRLIEEGRRQGLAEGLAEGLAKGRLQTQAQALLCVLATRKLPVSEELRARIEACQDIATLERWLERAVTAQSAADAISEA
jgi:hypothetical protein